MKLPSTLLSAAITLPVFLCVASPSLAASDVMVMSGTNRVEGTFQGLRMGYFDLLPSNSKQKVHVPKSKVDSLTVDPPASCDITVRMKSIMKSMKLRGMENGVVTVLKDGTTEIKLPLKDVENITMLVDFARAMQEQAEKAKDKEEAKPKDDEGAVDIEKSLKQGVATIVHFHLPDYPASVRNGNLINGEAERSRGTINVITIDVSDLKAPAPVKYGITTAPQFWFYDRNKTLVMKLTDRFTEADVQKGIKLIK